jgi:GT2 family glycosyltransferase
MTITASLVIYNCDYKSFLPLLDSIKNSSISVKLFIVDNSEIPRSYDFGDYSFVSYFSLCKNIGFGAAHNLIIDRVHKVSKYHIILNPDIFFDSHVLKSLVNKLESDDTIGMISPKIYYPDGRFQFSCKLLPTPLNLFSRFVFTKWFESLNYRLNYKYEIRGADYIHEMNVPCISGCFMLVRSSIISKVGGFDERFFMYLEDFDFSRRVNTISRVLFYPDVFIYHEHKKESFKRIKLMLVHILSAVRYFCKWGWFIDRERTKINKLSNESIVVNVIDK